MILEITDEQRLAARILGKQVYEARRSDSTVQKFERSSESDLSVNFLGFMAEIVIADWLGQERPKILDAPEEYDFLVDGKKWDVKLSEDHLVNLVQYEKKRGKVDIFVFCSLVPSVKGNLSDLKIDGWIPYDLIIKQRLKWFDNGTKAYVCKKLRPIEELMK